MPPSSTRAGWRANGTWTVQGREPAGLELEIAFRLGRSVGPEASAEQVLDAVAAAHVVFELRQSRIADPARLPRHVMLADCIANAGVRWLAPRSRAGARRISRLGRVGCSSTARFTPKATASIRLPLLLLLLPAMARRGKRIEAGQIVITGSLIGMNWLTGRHALKGVIEDCGEVAMNLGRGPSHGANGTLSGPPLPQASRPRPGRAALGLQGRIGISFQACRHRFLLALKPHAGGLRHGL